MLPYEPLDYDSLYELAEEQAIVGLIGAGLEHVEDRKVKKPEAEVSEEGIHFGM